MQQGVLTYRTLLGGIKFTLTVCGLELPTRNGGWHGAQCDILQRPPRVRHAPTVLGPFVALANAASPHAKIVLSLRLGQTTTQYGVRGLALRQDQPI